MLSRRSVIIGANLNKMTEILNNKKIAFIGYGLENQALLDWFKKHQAPAEYTICDSRPEIQKNIKGVVWRTGKNYLKNLSDFDIIYRSPGCPLFLPELKSVKNKISSAMNLFMELVPTKNIIGVTGSKGKGTTSSLIYTILKEAKKSVYLGGNIGVAPFTFLDKLTPDSYVVLELSSFQLEDFKISPRYSVLTNLFHEHLEPADPNNPNYHKNFKSYVEAKLNIARFKENKFFFTNEKLKKIIVTKKINGKVIYFSTCDLESKLAGEFNKENIAAAVSMAHILKIKDELIKKAVKKFIGLPHRLELVRNLNGINYYDNSFSTTPESTICDLKSFKNIIIILGGADKGADFKPLAKEVMKSAKLVILFSGTASPRLKNELLKAGLSKNKIKNASSMEAAINISSSQGKPGDTVLLSTACASFGLFKNYKERGDLFKKYVSSIK